MNIQPTLLYMCARSAFLFNEKKMIREKKRSPHLIFIRTHPCNTQLLSGRKIFDHRLRQKDSGKRICEQQMKQKKEGESADTEACMDEFCN